MQDRLEEDVETAYVSELEHDIKKLKEDKERLREERRRLRERKRKLRREAEALVDNYSELQIAVEELDDPRLDIYLESSRWETRYKTLKSELDKLPIELPDYITKI